MMRILALFQLLYICQCCLMPIDKIRCQRLKDGFQEVAQLPVEDVCSRFSQFGQHVPEQVCIIKMSLFYFLIFFTPHFCLFLQLHHIQYFVSVGDNEYDGE